MNKNQIPPSAPAQPEKHKVNKFGVAVALVIGVCGWAIMGNPANFVLGFFFAVVGVFILIYSILNKN